MAEPLKQSSTYSQDKRGAHQGLWCLRRLLVPSLTSSSLSPDPVYRRGLVLLPRELVPDLV